VKSLFFVCAIVASAFVAANSDNLLKPANKEESWRLEVAGDSKAAMKIDGDSVVFETSTVDSTDWHVQAVQTDLDLKDGKSYTIKFKAKSPDNVSITVNAMIDQEDWHQIGFNEEVQLGKEFKDFSFDFTASDTVTKKNRISFVLGGSKGQVSIKELTLKSK